MGTIGNVAKNISGIVSGAGSYISAGIGYIKGTSPEKQGYGY